MLARRDTAGLFPEGVAPEVTRGSLEDTDALAQLADGADVVIHAAGLVKARSRADFDTVNVDGSRRVAEAALAAGTPHVVLVSSLVAREPGLSHYSASKHAGEQVMAALLPGRLSIARPCAIYGPGDRELLPVFQAATLSPVLPLLSPTGRVAMIHVADAATQTAAIAAGPPIDSPVELSDGRPEGYGWADLMAAAARACGRSPQLLPAPPAVVRLLGRINDVAALLGATPMLTSAKARELLHPAWDVRPHENRALLPPARFDLETGFADTVAWYRREAWLKH